MNKDIVKLREKRSQRTGVKSLYLEMNRDGRRTFEFLHLYLKPGKDPATKAVNKAALEAAKTIQAKRIVEIQRGEADILAPKSRAVLFTDYIDEYLQRHSQMSPSHRKGMLITKQRWIDYAGDKVRIKEITPRMLTGFGEYLRGELTRYFYSNKDGAERQASTVVRLRPNSVRMHYDRIVWVLNAAHKDGLLPFNPAARVDAKEKPRIEKVERPYLTADELASLVATPCPDPELKRAFLFSCYTGLRKSDVQALTWDNIYNRSISVRMQKTGSPITIPLSPTAEKYLGTRGKKTEHPFTFKSDRQMYRDLVAWGNAAGIEKHVTFHMSRHTFATLALTYGADIYTISKLLGHTNLKTTQIYAQIVDKKKEEAVNLIPEF